MGRLHWYKRDPDAALSGMMGLTLQERGAYNTILDLLYSRGGDLDDDARLLCAAMNCHGNEWRAVRAKLIGKGKIWITADGKIMGKRVEGALDEAAEFSNRQRNRVGKRWEKSAIIAGNESEISAIIAGKDQHFSEKTNEINKTTIRPRNTNTTTTTTTTRIEEAIASSPPVSPPKRARAVQFDMADWRFDERARAICADHGYDPERIEQEIHDWGVNAAHGKRFKKDPHAFIRIWCSRNADQPRRPAGANGSGRPGPNRPSSGSIMEAAARVIARKTGGTGL